MSRFSRRRLLQTLSAIAAPSFVLNAQPQTSYPNKPVTLIVPQPAGGDADAFCRTTSAQDARVLRAVNGH